MDLFALGWWLFALYTEHWLNPIATDYIMLFNGLCNSLEAKWESLANSVTKRLIRECNLRGEVPDENKLRNRGNGRIAW